MSHIFSVVLMLLSTVSVFATEDEELPAAKIERIPRLCVMAAAGRAAEVATLIKAGAAVDETDARGNTPLHYACLENHKGVVMVLLSANARMDITDGDGSTALDTALGVADEEIILELLKNKVDPNLKDSRDRPLLCRAVDRNLLKVAERLLSMGADINAADQAGNTALHLAVINKSLAMATRLQKGGATVDTRNKAGFTALHYAVLGDQKDIVDMLLAAKADVSVATNMGATALHMAVRKGNVEVVKKLIDTGAPVNAIARSGDTPLYLALCNTHEDAAKLLVEHGAKYFTDDQTLWRRTIEALDDFSSAKPATTVRPDISALAISKDGSKLFNAVLRCGDIKMAGEFIEAGVDVTQMEPDGTTSLHLAAMRGDAEICKQIMDRSEVLSSVNDAGETPMSCAIRSNNAKTVELLIAKGAEVFTGDSTSWTAKLAAIMEASQEIIAILPDWNMAELAQRKDSAGLTLLYDAVRRGNTSIAAVLLSAHAEPNVVAKDGMTPLHLAMKSGSVEIAYDLIQHGADWRRKNAAGLTPADLAAQRPEEFTRLADKFISLGKRQAQCGDMVDARHTLRGGMLIHSSGSLDCPAATWFVSTFEYGDRPIEQEALAWAEARSFSEHEKARVILALAAHYFRKGNVERAKTILENNSVSVSELTPGIHVVHAFSLARLNLNEKAQEELKEVMAGDGHQNYRLMAQQFLEKGSLQVPAYSAPLAVLDRMVQAAAGKVMIESDLLP